MHGPGPRTLTNPLGWSPLWNGSRIPVVDSVIGQLPLLRRRSWRLARAKAIAMLEDRTGLSFMVTAGDPVMYTGNLPWVQPESFWALVPLLIPDAIRVVTTPAGTVEWGWYMDLWRGGGADTNPVPHPTGAVAMAWNTVTGEWLKRYKRADLAGLIAHELGHVLGLSHRTSGIMGGGNTLDDHDRVALRTYYAA